MQRFGHSLACLTLPLLGSWLGIACWVDEDNADYCARQEGDATCWERHGADLPFCGGRCVAAEYEDGCVPTRPANDCYIPCGGEMTLADDPDVTCVDVADDASTGDGMAAATGTGMTDEDATGTADGSSTASEEESEGSSTTGGLECTDTLPCTDLANPLCAGGVCVPCTETGEGNAACEALDTGLPVCAAGQCVLCTAEQPGVCLGTATPVCDVAGSRCVCTAHEQCGPGDEAACHIVAGTCFPSDESSVHHVGNGQAFPTLGDALAMVPEGSEAVLVLHDGDPDFNEAIALTGARVVAFKLASDASPELQWIHSDNDGEATLNLSGGAVAYLRGIRLRFGSGAAVVAVEGATATLQDCEVSGHDGLAISADGASVVVDRSIVDGNGGGIEATTGSTLTLTNVFVNGPVNGNAVSVEGSTLTAVYSTLGNATFDDDAALRCDETSMVVLRNALVLSQGGSSAIDCTGADTLTSALADSTTDPIFDVAWFSDYDNGDFHLQMSHPFGGVASWQVGDPVTDIDGDPRPAVPGPDVAGADVPINP